MHLDASGSERVNAGRALLGALGGAAIIAIALAGLLSTSRGHSGLHVGVTIALCAWGLTVAGLIAVGPVRLGALVGAASLTASCATYVTFVGTRTSASPLSTTRQLGFVLVACSAAIALHAVLSLPDGVLGSRPRQVGAAAWYVIAIALGVAMRSRSLSEAVVALASVIAFASVVPAATARYQRSTGAGRERMQWVGVGAVGALEVALVAGALNLLVRWPAPIKMITVVGSALIPLGLLIAQSSILRPKGGRVFVRALSILGFSAVVAAVYLIVVLGLGSRPTTTSDREVLGLSILAAAIVAVGYVPARDRILRSATGFVYGATEAPDEVVRSFGSRLTRAIPMDELLLQLAESLRKTLTLSSAEIYTGTGDVLELAVSVPDLGERSLVVAGRERPVITAAGVSGNAWAAVWLPALLEGRPARQLRVAPISHAGELLGLIVVERPVAASSFSEEDDRVLTELARQVGLAFHNAQLDSALQTSLDELRRQADELRASRARIVASGDAERRRVERDLHDGAQQHLVALAVNLRLARDVLLEDPEAAAEMLAELGVAVQDTIQELRELAHGIYPPLLVDSGLGEALRAVVHRSPLDASLQTEGIGRYDADVEAAIYFCCLEALQNAAKHASESHVTVRVWEESGGLLFEVADDGPGFDVRLARRGHGFVNMSDRLGAIGGAVRWESVVDKGTSIKGSVPVR